MQSNFIINSLEILAGGRMAKPGSERDLLCARWIVVAYGLPAARADELLFIFIDLCDVRIAIDVDTSVFKRAPIFLKDYVRK